MRKSNNFYNFSKTNVLKLSLTIPAQDTYWINFTATILLFSFFSIFFKSSNVASSSNGAVSSVFHTLCSTVQCQRGKRRLRRQRSSLSFAPNLVRLAQGDGAGEGAAVGQGEGEGEGVGPILAGNCNGNNNNGCCCCCSVVVAVAYYWLGLVKSFVMFLSWCPVTLICCRKCNFWHRRCRLLCLLPATVAVVIVIIIGCIQWTSPGDVIRWRTSRRKSENC